MRRASAFVAALVLLVGVPPNAQQIPTIRADVNLVQIGVRVTDSNGRPVRALTKDAFQLRVDGVLQPITVFQGEDAPVTAGIIIDNSASMAPKRAEVAAAAMAFARASNSQDHMFVVHFNDRAWFGLAPGAFARDLKELEAAVSRFELGGTTALYDAVLTALPQFARSMHARKIVLLVTDGGDNSSAATVPQVTQAVLENGVSIFAVGIFDEADHDNNPEVLQQMARLTGGAAFFPASTREITRICEQIASDIRQQYTIGFAGAEDGKYHEIQLRVTDPRYDSLQVHTRQGYGAAKRQ